MRVVSIWYNSKGEIEIVHRDNASDKRILQILRKAVKKLANSGGEQELFWQSVGFKKRRRNIGKLRRTVLVIPKMMICPIDKCTAEGTKETPHCRKHKWCQSCANPKLRKHKTCPACIPYEPESACLSFGNIARDAIEKQKPILPKDVRSSKPQPEKHLICLCMDDGCGFANPYCPIHGEQPTPTMPLREQLAELEHEQWVEWSQSLAGSKEDVLSPDRKKRWLGLWRPYKTLTEEQKDQDRVWADKVLTIMQAHDSAIRREFAEKVIAQIKGRVITPEWENVIRAMAEKEG